MACFPNIRIHLYSVRGHLPYPRRSVLVLLVSFMLAAAAVLPAGCTTMARITDLTGAPCRAAFEEAISSLLTEQGEKKDTAHLLAYRTYLMLSKAELGPRPFLVASPSGTDYSFFIQKKRERCLLRLYGRQKGFMSYTNNLTYIATRDLMACSCQE